MKIIKRDYKPNSTASKFGNDHGEIVATLSTLCATWSWGKESQEQQAGQAMIKAKQMQCSFLFRMNIIL
jgi:hypothetical protein